MMFNGLLMCTDSDSDFKGSVGRSSEFESPSSSCASARAQYYQNKLLATLQILQNKEETVRVQTESLAVAEARIASLTARSNQLQRELQRTVRDFKALQQTVQESSVEKTDVSVTAKDVDNQNIVTVLQNNLSVIEEFYRECFYETAKQEGLIEMLRKSYLDVRLMDKEKSEQISRLHNMINTQKWSLDRFQDMASDVDNLKVEISNFLNSSNNDSGVWEEAIAGNLTEDLQDIAGQLLRLRELLTGDCICGLEEENIRLRQSNEEYKIQINELSQKIADLENTITNKNYSDKDLQDLIETKETELHSIREQLAALSEETESCQSVKVQLHRAQELLKETTSQLSAREAQCQQQERSVAALRDQLHRTEDVGKQNRRIRVRQLRNSQRMLQYCSLRGRAGAAQEQVGALRAELRAALCRCAQADDHHRAQVRSLEAGLREARARGAALCAEARRALRSLRAQAHSGTCHHQELEEQINQKECKIKQLKRCLERERNNATLTRESERLIEVDNKSAQCDSSSNRELDDEQIQQESEIKLLKQRLDRDDSFYLTRQSGRLSELERRSTCDCRESKMLISNRDLEKETEQKVSKMKLLKQRRERKENNGTLARETELVIDVENRCTECDCGRSLFEDGSCDRNRKETSGSKCQTTFSFKSLKGRKRQEIPSEESGCGVASSTPLPACACPHSKQTSPQTFMKRFFGDRWFCSPSYHEAIVQNPIRCDATTCSSDLEEPSCSNRHTTLGSISGERQRREQPCEASTSGIDSTTLRLTAAGPSAPGAQFVDERLSIEGGSPASGAPRSARYHAAHAAVSPAPVLTARSRPRDHAHREHRSMEDVLSRVQSAGAALQGSRERWTRRAAHRRL